MDREKTIELGKERNKINLFSSNNRIILLY